MAWTERESEEDDEYHAKLCYSRGNSIFAEEGLHVGCNIYGHWQTLNNFHIGNIAVDGKSAYTGSIPIVTSIQDNGDGTITWSFSNLQVRNGIIVGYWT